MQTALITSLPPPLTPEKRANKNAAFDVAAKSWLAFFSSTTTTTTATTATTITSCGVRAQGWKRGKIKRKGERFLKDRIIVPANLPVISGERWRMVEGVDDDTRRWSVTSSLSGIYRVILNYPFHQTLRAYSSFIKPYRVNMAWRHNSLSVHFLLELQTLTGVR